MRTALDRKLAEEIAAERFDGCTIAAIHYDRKGGLLNLYVETGYPDGEVALQFYIGKGNERVLEVTEDEPRGAGADPYGRPDPGKSPEYWTE